MQTITCLSCGQTFSRTPDANGLYPLCRAPVDGTSLRANASRDGPGGSERPVLLTKRRLASAWVIASLCAAAFGALGAMTVAEGTIDLGIFLLVAAVFCLAPVALSGLSRHRAAVLACAGASLWGFPLIPLFIDLPDEHGLPPGDAEIVAPVFGLLALLMGFSLTRFAPLRAAAFTMSYLAIGGIAAFVVMIFTHTRVPGYYAVIVAGNSGWFPSSGVRAHWASTAAAVILWIAWIGRTAIRARRVCPGSA